MKPKKIFFPLLLFLGMGFIMYAGAGNPQEKEPEERKGKGLIRKELLLRKKKELEPVRRNIFSPRNSRREREEANTAWIQENPQEIPTISREGASHSASNIRYVGCVVSENKIVALIFFGGDVLVVKEGEKIGVNVRVGKITREEIEIISASSKRRKYPLEGEKE